MSANTTKAYEDMGSILARLPFINSLKTLYGSSISEEECEALGQAMRVSVSALMRARQYYQLGEDGVDGCAAGFARVLVDLFVGTRREDKPTAQRMRVDGNEWELVFDPGPRMDQLRTDEKGRVWRKVEIFAFDDVELPF